MKNSITFHGMPVVNGFIRSECVVLDSSDCFMNCERVAGKIVIIRIASPAIVIWLRNAAGLVVEKGGITSHGAIIARELNIPSIVGVDNIYDNKFNGCLAELDSKNGTMEICYE